MNIYLLEQSENNDYDTHDSLVVIAENEEEAKKIHPDSDGWTNNYWNTWASSPDKVKCTFLGKASKECIEKAHGNIVLASFNAG